MRFTSIWTVPAMSLGERLRRTRDWGAMRAALALPLRVRYWGAIQAIGYASANSPNVPATPLSDIIENLERPKYVS